MTTPGTAPTAPAGALDGLRVVDLTVEVGELAGRLLADLGAEVVRVEAPGGSPSRALPPFAPDGTGLWWLYRNSNKRGVVLDVDDADDRGRLHELLAGADVLLDSAPPGARDGLGAPALAARYPRLVVTSMTWFGLTGPYAEYVATDDVVLAMCGWLAAAGLSTRDPLLVPGSLPSDAVGVMGALASLAALWQRRVTGRGQLLDVSAFEATIQVDTWSVVNASAIANAGMDARRLRNAQDSLYPTIRTRDGWIRLVLLSPRQWRALWEWMGSPEAFADPYWEQTFARFENRDVLHPMFDEFFASMGMVDAAAEGQRRGVVVMPILKPDDILADEHFRSRETFVTAEIAPGLTVPVTAGFFQLDGTRAGFREAAPAPAPAGPGDPIWLVDADPVAQSAATPEQVVPAPAGGPLSDLLVVDFGHGGVGVQAGRMFAENGADVIKVETRSYPDFMRVIMGTEMTPSFASSSRSKRSFGVNLKRPEGRELAKRLVAMADVVIENNSTGTMADLGLGFDELAEVNPRLVYVSSQLLGSRGKHAAWLGYGPSVQAYGGLTDLWSYADGPPVGGNSNHPDLLVGHLCALVGLAGLLRREHTGDGTHCEVAQVETVVATLGDLLLAEALAPGSVRPVGNDDERGAPWGVFRCSGDEEWCVVCVRDDADWAALRRAMGDPGWAADERWSTHEGRRAGRDELAERVGAWTAALTPAEVGDACQAAGVPGAPMQYASQLLGDPQLAARGFLATVQQADAGALTFDGVSFRASDMAAQHIAAAPRLGEHTRELCRDVLGLDLAEIDRLVADGVLEVAPAVEQNGTP